MCVPIVSLTSIIAGGYFQALRNCFQASRPKNPSVSRKLNKEGGGERMTRKQGVRNENNIKAYK